MSFFLLCVISVGEPINHEAWDWLHKVVGDSRCTLVDTWWQTGESGSQEGRQGPREPVQGSPRGPFLQQLGCPVTAQRARGRALSVGAQA